MFRWLAALKRPRSARIPERVLAPVEEIAEQGLMVADVAVRLSVKNAIIMNALAKHVDYSSDQVEQLVRDALTELSEEREQDAKRLDLVMKDLDMFGHSGRADTDYGMDDNRTIKHRRAVYRLVAAELADRREDHEYVKHAAEQARLAAWAEIGDALKTKAEHPYYGGGQTEEYRSKRDERIQRFIEKDLTQLIRQRDTSK